MTDARLVADIDRSESCRLTAYRDSRGLWTIGWGHLLDQSVDWTGHAISQAQADQWRDIDILKAEMYAGRLPEWVSLDTVCRRNAVAELCFNMGARWLGFHDTRTAIAVRSWQRAHDKLLDSEWAAEVQPHTFHADRCIHCGLPKAQAGPKSYCTARSDGRAFRLANYLLTGAYPAVS